jgi:hypothetical protein
MHLGIFYEKSPDDSQFSTKRDILNVCDIIVRGHYSLIRLRIEGKEPDVKDFLKQLPEIPGYELSYVREPKIGNNPKYTNNNVLSYLTFQKKPNVIK